MRPKKVGLESDCQSALKSDLESDTKDFKAPLTKTILLPISWICSYFNHLLISLCPSEGGSPCWAEMKTPFQRTFQLPGLRGTACVRQPSQHDGRRRHRVFVWWVCRLAHDHKFIFYLSIGRTKNQILISAISAHFSPTTEMTSSFQPKISFQPNSWNENY